MKRISFTAENRTANRDGRKWQTRRLHNTPQYRVDDLVIHCEPTQVLTISPHTMTVDLLYPDTGDKTTVSVSNQTLTRLQARQDPSKPAIARFMFNDFARYYLRITDVKTEPIQLLSAEDAIAEGVLCDSYVGNKPASAVWFNYLDQVFDGSLTGPQDSFRTLWSSIHKDSDKQWAANPVVTAYSYEFLWSLPFCEVSP